MRVLFLAMLLFQTSLGLGQEVGISASSFKKKQLQGMSVLAAWSVVNLASGVAGNLHVQDPTQRRFHQMNWMWNTVNFGLAGAAFAGHKKYDGLNTSAKIAEQAGKQKKIFLINGLLDVAYMTAGGLMWVRSSSFNQPDLMKGYGQSILIQGAFLFVFDRVMYEWNRRVEKRLNLKQVELHTSPLGFQFVF